TNSLLDAVVHGRRTGKTIAKFLRDADLLPLPKDVEKKDRAMFEKLYATTSGENADKIRVRLKEEMTNKCGVFRNEKDLLSMLDTIHELKEKFKNIILKTGKIIYERKSQ
ncbi:MAG: FAD-binding protein, partial [Actinomycetota bacterium]